MADQHTIEDLLARLERERLEADRLYNDALTAVDRAIQRAPVLPDAPRAYDAARVADVNGAWDILPSGAPAIDRSLKGRLRAFIWRLVGPPFETQKRFNAAVADHINRNVAAHEEAPRAMAALVAELRRDLEALVRFESLLVQYLQTITVYVDSKDRSLGGPELRQRLALTEQRLLALKRDVEQGAPRAGASTDARAAGAEAPFSGPVDSLTYVAFEDRFRGTTADIGRRVEDYLPIVAAASDVVDIGCGRGELLEALRERGVRARGVDVNAAMVELCRSRGFDVEQGDALSFLERQRDGSIGGMIAIQVVEHFTPGYLTRFLEMAFHKMTAGAPLILETINPACWMAFFETYIRDPTHRQPLHPETLKYLVQASGFSQVDVQFREPVREQDRLQRVSDAIRSFENTSADLSAADGRLKRHPPAEGEVAVSRIAAALNDHADKLNSRLFSSMDYVVVARR